MVYAVLTVTAPGTDPIDVSHCVQGSTLHLIDIDPVTGAATSDVVATKSGSG